MVPFNNQVRVSVMPGQKNGMPRIFTEFSIFKSATAPKQSMSISVNSKLTL